MSKMKHLSIVVPSEQTTLSTVACIVGTHQLFTTANNYYKKRTGTARFKIDLVGASKAEHLVNDFVSIQHQRVCSAVTKTDLIIVPATSVRSYALATKNNQELINWLRKHYKAGAEIASMCVGSFMLAATGVLNGKSCSTHWAMADEFRELFPEVQLVPDQLITDDQGVYTNGGAYSFLNLLLYLVEKFYDRSTAIHCAKYFQIEMDRELQSEFMIFKGHKHHQDKEILSAQKVIEKHYQQKISIEQLASKVNVGRRNFDRRFMKATGISALEYLQRVKIESAKKMFESSRKTINEVMFEVGYNDTKAFREVFKRLTGLSPVDYKTKYNKALCN